MQPHLKDVAALPCETVRPGNQSLKP